MESSRCSERSLKNVPLTLLCYYGDSLVHLQFCFQVTHTDHRVIQTARWHFILSEIQIIDQFLEKRLTNISWFFFHLVAGRCIYLDALFWQIVLPLFTKLLYVLYMQCWHFWRDFICQKKGTITLNYLIKEQPRLLIFGLFAGLLANFHLLKFSLPPHCSFFHAVNDFFNSLLVYSILLNKIQIFTDFVILLTKKNLIMIHKNSEFILREKMWRAH